MQNVESEQFDYESFKNAFDTDPRIKTMVATFNNVGIEPKTKNKINDKEVSTDDKNEVEKMAKSATDLGDKLS